jgi:hypothetical protein
MYVVVRPRDWSVEKNNMGLLTQVTRVAEKGLWLKQHTDSDSLLFS